MYVVYVLGIFCGNTSRSGAIRRHGSLFALNSGNVIAIEYHGKRILIIVTERIYLRRTLTSEEQRKLTIIP